MADLFPGALGDVVLPAAGFFIYAAFTTVHAFTDRVLPYVKAGTPPTPSGKHSEAVGKFFSSVTGKEVSPEDAAKFFETLESPKWYWKEPRVFVSHNALSLPWAILSPLQFSSYVRENYPNFHIWNGRFLLFTLIPTTLTGFRLGMNSNVGKSRMMPLGVLLAGYVFTQLIKGYQAIVATPRRMQEHRLRMTKLAICLIGIPVIRFVFMAVLLPLIGKIPSPLIKEPKDGNDKLRQTLGLSFIATMLGTIASAELYGHLLEKKRSNMLKGL